MATPAEIFDAFCADCFEADVTDQEFKLLVGVALCTINTAIINGGGGGGGVPTSRQINTTSPLQGGGDLSADRTLSILDAVADGATKGAAAFIAADFNSAAGVVSIDYTNGQAASAGAKGFLTAADWITFNSKGSGTVTSIATTSPITGGTITGTGTIAINDAAADGVTKGAAAFTAADFNASSGVISIDYTNGQAAASGVKGFLTAADWATFTAKEAALTFNTPLSRSVNAISLRTVRTATIFSDGNWNGETLPVMQTSAGTIARVRATALGSSTPTLAFNLQVRGATGLNSAGTNVFSSDQSATGAGLNTTTFAFATLAEGDHIVAVTPGSGAEGGTVDALVITVEYS